MRPPIRCGVFALLLVVTCKADRLPGRWVAVAPEKLPEAGITQWTLYRQRGATRERVDDLVARYRVYGDCIAYEKISVHDEYRVACGDAPPVVIVRGEGEWTLGDSGLSQSGRLVTRDARVLREQRMISIDALRATVTGGGRARPAIAVTLIPLNPDDVTDDGDTALATAVLAGDSAAVKVLIENGADPNQPGEDGRYPVVLAAYRGKPDVVESLLAAGARLDVTISGVGPVTAAADRNHLHVVRLLVQSGRAAAADVQMARSNARNRPDILELLPD